MVRIDHQTNSPILFFRVESPAGVAKSESSDSLLTALNNSCDEKDRRSSDAGVFAVPPANSLPAYSQRGAPGKDQTTRKKKAKAPKQRTIKFHEYKVRSCMNLGGDFDQT